MDIRCYVSMYVQSMHTYTHTFNKTLSTLFIKKCHMLVYIPYRSDSTLYVRVGSRLINARTDCTKQSIPTTEEDIPHYTFLLM